MQQTTKKLKTEVHHKFKLLTKIEYITFTDKLEKKLKTKVKFDICPL